jgi:hypothetical protein
MLIVETLILKLNLGLGGKWVGWGHVMSISFGAKPVLTLTLDNEIFTEEF